jgi:hypothetical protein
MSAYRPASWCKRATGIARALQADLQGANVIRGIAGAHRAGLRVADPRACCSPTGPRPPPMHCWRSCRSCAVSRISTIVGPSVCSATGDGGGRRRGVLWRWPRSILPAAAHSRRSSRDDRGCWSPTRWLHRPVPYGIARAALQASPVAPCARPGLAVRRAADAECRSALRHFLRRPHNRCRRRMTGPRSPLYGDGPATGASACADRGPRGRLADPAAPAAWRSPCRARCRQYRGDRFCRSMSALAVALVAGFHPDRRRPMITQIYGAEFTTGSSRSPSPSVLPRASVSCARRSRNWRSPRAARAIRRAPISCARWR